MTDTSQKLNRQCVVARILSRRSEELVLSGLGNPSWDVFNAADDRDDNFYLWGAMGGSACMGLGLAIAQPNRRVLVITGDGDLLMGLGSLATIGAHSAENLVVIVIDNELYAETGHQPTHTASGVDLAGVALSCGFAHSLQVRTEAELDSALPTIYDKAGPTLVSVKVDSSTARKALPPRHGPNLKDRFRRAIGIVT